MSFYEMEKKSKSVPKNNLILTTSQIKKNKLITNKTDKRFFPIMRLNKTQYFNNKTENTPLYNRKIKINEKNSFFLTNTNKFENRNKKNNSQLSKGCIFNKTVSNYITNKIKIFENEDELIRSFLDKLNPKQEKKIIKRENRARTLNKLYGIMKEQKDHLIEAKRKKYLPLEKYQQNILYAFTENNNNMDYGDFMELVQGLKQIKEDTESVSPLPPVNFRSIYNHVIKTSRNKKLKNLTIREYLNKGNEPKDDFEKENILIKKIHKSRLLVERRRNKNLDLLPQHIRELFDKRLKAKKLKI